MNSERSGHALGEQLRSAVRDFASSIHSASQVVADMSSLIHATASLPLSNLAYWERLIRGEFSLAERAHAESRKQGWRALLSFTGPKGNAEPSRFLTWIDLSSWDGYVRERTLRTLAAPAPNGFFFALAARRLNDWVPQVRLAARQAIPLLARATDPEHVSDALCAMLPNWTTWGRLDTGDRQVLAELVSIEKVAESLKRRVIGSVAGPMAAVLGQALRTETLDKQLVEIASCAVQSAVRAKAYRTLLSGKAVWIEGQQWAWTDVRYCQGRMRNVLGERLLTNAPIFLESLNLAATDRSSIVRRVAAEALVRETSSLGSSAVDLARRFAADSSPPVAERGAFVLQRIGAPASTAASQRTGDVG